MDRIERTAAILLILFKIIKCDFTRIRNSEVNKINILLVLSIMFFVTVDLYVLLLLMFQVFLKQIQKWSKNIVGKIINKKKKKF